MKSLTCLLTLLTVSSFLTARPAQAQYAWTNFAGLPGGPGSLDGTGSEARFYQPYGLAADSSGNVYVADSRNSTIRKITPAGVVTTLAGRAGSTGSTDGAGSDARFNEAGAVAVDASGTIYVADTRNNTIRKITSGGVVSTLAGAAGASGSTDGTGSAARFNWPFGLALDATGNLYVADWLNSTIRKVTSAGVVTTLAGSPGQIGSLDGTGSAARFSNPTGVAVDGSGNILVTDEANHTIRKVTSAGVVTTLAGSAGNSGSADGTGTVARFNRPHSLAVDGGNIYVADSINQNIRKVTGAGVVTTLAGSAGMSGAVDASGSAARFNSPIGISVKPGGDLYLTDANNHVIRQVTKAGAVTTLAGSLGGPGSADGQGSLARFNFLTGVAVTSTGDLYAADTKNHTIRKITAAGLVTTVAGTPLSHNSTDGTGSVARFYEPGGLTVNAAGIVYVADTLNQTVRKIVSGGVVTTLAGMAGEPEFADGTGSAARFSTPQGATVDAAGNLYVADGGNGVIRKVTPTGVVTTLAGSPGNFGSADGTGGAALFSQITGIAVDGGGNLFVCDRANHNIRKVTSAGVVTTFAGTAGSEGTADGSGSAARFSHPFGIAVDSSGNVYVTDTYNQTIRKITSGGVVTTIGGSPGIIGVTDGTGSAARFNYPGGVAVNAAGVLYVADYGNHRIRKGVASSAPSGLDAWRQTYFGTIQNSGSAANTFDFDHDGLVNLVEYAFGLNPLSGASVLLPQAQRAGASLTISFTQPAGVTGITYGAQWSPSMTAGSWSSLSDSGTGSIHTFTVPVDAGVKTKFFRLTVTVP